MSFDKYAKNYENSLNAGLRISGEKMEYFARSRINRLKACISNMKINQIMDYGCGIGKTIPILQKSFTPDSIIGIDISEESMHVARQQLNLQTVSFFHPDSYIPTASIQLVYCNGIFHHVAKEHYETTLKFIYNSLCPGGIFSFWENNPWNIGTRYVMSKIPFDKNAILIFPHNAKKMLKKAGFEIIRTDFLFIFPHSLRFLRKVENWTLHIPFGAQYQIIAQKI